MKRIKVLAAIFFLSKILLAQNYQFVQDGGGVSLDLAGSVSIDNAGNCYSTGLYTGTAVFGNITIPNAGFRDIYITKQSPSGSLLWVKHAGGVFVDGGVKVLNDAAGNLYVTGTIEGLTHFDGITVIVNGGPLWDGEDVFLAKIDPSGNYLWVKNYGGVSQDWVSDFGFDPLGNLILTGFFYDTFTAGTIALNSAGELDIFIMKVDTAGTPIWGKRIGGASVDQSPVLNCRNNFIYQAGTFAGTVNFDGTILTSQGLSDIYVAKFDLSGNQVWVKRAGGSGSEIVKQLITDNSENIYMNGSFENTAFFGGNSVTSSGMLDIFLAKYNLAGDNLWVKSAGGSTTDVGNAVVIDNSGNIYISGYFSSTATFENTQVNSNGSNDIYLAKYTPGGNFLSIITAGGTSTDAALGLVTDAGNNLYMSGVFSNSVDFGNFNVTSHGVTDVFVLKISPLVGIVNENTNADMFSLGQNYPNPFNPVTKIRFDIPSNEKRETSNVKLVIYDLLGREIATLVNGRYKPGTYEVNWDAANYPSGIYFYTLTSGNFSDTKKMILLK